MLLYGTVFAASPKCDNFQINIQNNLADDLVVSTIRLVGAEIQPKTIEHIAHGTSQVFTVNNSNENVPMTGEFTLHTISLPMKTIKITYTLDNKATFCEHTDIATEGDYSAIKSRPVGGVTYTIVNQ